MGFYHLLGAGGFLVAAGGLTPRGGGLRGGGARQHQAQRALEHVAREAAAVEAFVGAVAAATVAHAEEVHRGAGQLAGLVAQAVDEGAGLDRRRPEAAFGEPVRDRVGRCVGLGVRRQRRPAGEGGDDQPGGEAGAELQHGREGSGSPDAASTDATPCFDAVRRH